MSRFSDALTPQGQALNLWEDEQNASDLYRQARGLPCQVVSVQNQHVTVSFLVQAQANQTPVTLPQITIPIATWVYIRIPVQVGDLGMTVSADVNLSGIDGQGNSGAVPLVKSANLSGLAFLPIASTQWDPAPDPKAVYIAGPEGVILGRMKDDQTSIVLDANGITLTGGGITVSITNAGVTIDGVLWETHAHLYAPGSGTPTDTGPPLSGA